MVEKICLDSDILIDLLNGEEYTKNLLENKPDSLLCTTTINIFELLCGRKEKEQVPSLADYMVCFNFDKGSANLASNIFMRLKKEGKLIDIRDLFIGSICIFKDLILFTLNKKHFERLKKFGLRLYDLESYK